MVYGSYFADPCSSSSGPCVSQRLPWRGDEQSLLVESKATSFPEDGGTLSKVGLRYPGTDVHHPSPRDAHSLVDRENHRSAPSEENINPCPWLLSRREDLLTGTFVYTKHVAVEIICLNCLRQGAPNSYRRLPRMQADPWGTFYFFIIF